MNNFRDAGSHRHHPGGALDLALERVEAIWAASGTSVAETVPTRPPPHLQAFKPDTVPSPLEGK